jgi:hypothetical protein
LNRVCAFEPVTDIRESNECAFAWANAYNANLIPGQDTRLRRDGWCNRYRGA